MKTRVLFLCAGNSARSQMAEGWARSLAGDKLEVYSAGTRPQGVNPLAIEVMKEAGIDISGQRSKSVNEFIDKQFDYVITLCDDAARACPVFSGSAKVIHQGFYDPALAKGTNEVKLQAFREVRDSIREFVEDFVVNI